MDLTLLVLCLFLLFIGRVAVVTTLPAISCAEQWAQVGLIENGVLRGWTQWHLIYAISVLSAVLTAIAILQPGARSRLFKTALLLGFLSSAQAFRLVLPLPASDSLRVLDGMLTVSYAAVHPDAPQWAKDDAALYNTQTTCVFLGTNEVVDMVST